MFSMFEIWLVEKQLGCDVALLILLRHLEVIVPSSMVNRPFM